MKFSQRMGIAPVHSTLQVHEMSNALRNALWNILDEQIWSQERFIYYNDRIGYINEFSKDLWANFFKLPFDTRANGPLPILKSIRTWYFKAEWYEIYDFFEFVINYMKDVKLIKSVNKVLEAELAGYRCIKSVFVPVTDELELEAIDKALTDNPFSGVHSHIKQALEHLSRRENPDYRNSIKESISAVESLARELTGKKSATLGDALTELEKKHKLHPALKKCFSAIYGYSSDEGGIRHAMSEVSDIDVSDAKFMLISCVTFINYLKSKLIIST